MARPAMVAVETAMQSPVRIGIAFAAMVGIGACGNPLRTGANAGDAGTSAKDLAPGRDLAADVVVVPSDAADLPGMAPDVALETQGGDRPDVVQPMAEEAGRADRVQREVAASDVAPESALDGRGDAHQDRTAIDIGVDRGESAVLTVVPTDADFGVTLGEPSDPVVFTVSNVGSVASGTPTVTTTGCSHYDVTSNSCTKPLPSGQSCQISVVFAAAGGAGTCNASLIISADGFPGGKATIPMTGATP